MEWVRCSERLPERDESVVITLDTLTGRITASDGAFYMGMWRWAFDGSPITSLVVAWQPRQPAYDGEA